MTGDTIHDQGCSLKVYRRKCLEGLDFCRDLHRRYITAILRWKGYRVGEMKIRHHRRQYGSSKVYDSKEVDRPAGSADRGLLDPAFRPTGSRGKRAYVIERLEGLDGKTPS